MTSSISALSCPSDRVRFATEPFGPDSGAASGRLFDPSFDFRGSNGHKLDAPSPYGQFVASYFGGSAGVGATAAQAAPVRSSLDDVRGTQAQPIDLDLAQAARDVYDAKSVGFDDYVRLDDSALNAAGIDAELLLDADSGFQAALYRGADGRHVLAFAGTQDWPDWKQNLRQGIGAESAQYHMAQELAVKSVAAFGDSLVITGHSLGGGLASAAALACGAPAVTFNAAGLSDATIEQLTHGADAGTIRDLYAQNGEIRRYQVEGEILTRLQEETPLASNLMPDAIGADIHLEPAEPAPAGTNPWIPDSIERALAWHSVESVIPLMPH